MLRVFNRSSFFSPLLIAQLFWGMIYTLWLQNIPWQQIAQLNYMQCVYMKEGRGVLSFIDPWPDDFICYSLVLQKIQNSHSVFITSSFCFFVVMSYLPLVVFLLKLKNLFPRNAALNRTHSVLLIFLSLLWLLRGPEIKENILRCTGFTLHMQMNVLHAVNSIAQLEFCMTWCTGEFKHCCSRKLSYLCG